jgi:hypothetical protein
MASGVDRHGGSADVDGVRIVRKGRRGADLGMAVVVGIGLALAIGTWRRDVDQVPAAVGVVVPPPVRGAAPASTPAASADAAPSASTGQDVPRTRGARLRALRAVGVTPTKGPDGKRELAAAPVIEALQRAGVRDGIAAFPPPGTDPPKSGIIVPDDWVLPEGYVRHHQTTDDGVQLPPILMFHPDYAFEDEHGARIAVPPDRIVPPELAPPGLAVRLLDVPTRSR